MNQNGKEMNFNDFEIENAKERVCQIYDCRLGHSSLIVVIRPTAENKQRFIAFRDVRYIEGPISWAGAVFKEKTPEESLKFAQSIGLYGVNKGAYTLFEAAVNRPILANPSWIRNFLFSLYLKGLSMSPFSIYKNCTVRILAAYASLISEEDYEKIAD